LAENTFSIADNQWIVFDFGKDEIQEKSNGRLIQQILIGANQCHRRTIN